MMIIRIILLLLVIFILYRLYTTLERKLAQRQLNKSAKTEIDKVSQCYTCGVYIPEKELLEEQGHNFCSRECINQQKKGDN